MKKGIIFSLDATYGLIVVFFTLGMLSFYYSGSTNTTGFAEKTGTETNDYAIIGFYTDKDGTDFGLDSLNSISNQEFIECAQHSLFELEESAGNSNSQSDLERKNYCRVMEWQKE